MSGQGIHIAHKEYQPDLYPVILLHGLTSAKETWDECAKVIANRTGAKVYWYDARNHGDSEWSGKMNYEVMADDLACFMDSMNIPKAIVVGHSMGGKTGMSFALKYPERLHCLVIEDIPLRSSFDSREHVVSYIKMMKNILHKIPPETKLSEAKRIAAYFLTGRDPDIQKTESSSRSKLWDGSDLPLKCKTGGGFEWKTNLNILRDAITNGTWGSISSEGTYEGPFLSIYGTRSPYRVLDDKERMLKQFPNAVYEPIEGGSHSLHVEYPEIFNKLVCDFIMEQRS